MREDLESGLIALARLKAVHEVNGLGVRLAGSPDLPGPAMDDWMMIVETTLVDYVE